MKGIVIVLAGLAFLVVGVLTFAPVSGPALSSTSAFDGLEDFTVANRGVRAPRDALMAMDGTLGDLSAFEGQILLVNVWATWCPPCVVELPSLERLNDEFSSAGLKIAAVSVDQGGWATINSFIDRHKIRLPFYLDASGDQISTFEFMNLPTTIVYGPDGREIGRVEGAALWDSPRGKSIIRQAIQGAL